MKARARLVDEVIAVLPRSATDLPIGLRYRFDRGACWRAASTGRRPLPLTRRSGRLGEAPDRHSGSRPIHKPVPRSSTTSASTRCAACWRQRPRGSSKQTTDQRRLPDPAERGSLHAGDSTQRDFPLFVIAEVCSAPHTCRISPAATVSPRSTQTSGFRAAPRGDRTGASKRDRLLSVRNLQAEDSGRYRSSGRSSSPDADARLE
jgi:hypothetical protein